MADTPPPDPEDVRVGATIRQLREDRDLSAAELGRLIGKSEPMVTAIERGQRHATLTTCKDIARALGVRLAVITVKDFADIADKAS